MGRYSQNLNNGITPGLALKNLQAYDEDIKRRKENLEKKKISTGNTQNMLNSVSPLNLENFNKKTFGTVTIPKGDGSPRAVTISKPAYNQAVKQASVYLNNQIIEIPITDKKKINISYGTAKKIDDFVASDSEKNASRFTDGGIVLDKKYIKAKQLDEFVQQLGLKGEELESAKSYAGLKKLAFSSETDGKASVWDYISAPFTYFGSGLDKAAGTFGRLIKTGFGTDGGEYDNALADEAKYYEENPDELGHDMYDRNNMSEYIKNGDYDRILSRYKDLPKWYQFVNEVGFKSAGEMIGSAALMQGIGVDSALKGASTVLKGVTAGTKAGDVLSKFSNLSPNIKNVPIKGVTGKVINAGINKVNKATLGSAIKFLNPLDNPTTALMGVGAMQNKYDELRKMGYSHKKAMTNSLFTGYVSAITEKMGYDGTPQSMFLINGKEILGDATSSKGKNIYKTIKSYLSLNASEGLEEVYSAIFERTGDYFSKVGYIDENGKLKRRGIIGKEGVMDFSNLAESFAGGFIGGAVMGSVGFMSNLAHKDVDTVRAYGKHINKTIDENDAMLKEMAESAGVDITLPKRPDFNNATVEEMAKYYEERTEAYNEIIKNDIIKAHDEQIVNAAIQNIKSDMDVLKESFNFEAYSDEDLKQMNQSFLGGVIIGTGQSAVHLGFNASWNTAVNKLSKAADAKTMGKLIIENSQSDSIIRKTFEYAMKTDNAKIKNEANLLLSEFQANGNSFSGVKNVEKRLGNIALGLTQEGQNVFSQNSVFNPHAKIDNLTQRILNGKDVTNQELMLYNQTKNKNRFKVLTGIDLTGNPVEVRNQLNSMIKEGKSKSAVVGVVNKILQGEEITGADIDSLVEHKDYLAKASQIEIEGNTDAEIRSSVENIVSQLKERAAVRNGVNNDSISNTKRVEAGDVPSSVNGRGSHTSVNSNNKVSQNNPVVNNSMQNNSDNTSNSKENKGTRLTINNIRSFGFKNQKALERIAGEYKLYYNPEAAEAEYNPEENSITIRNEADAIHEAAHALKNSMNALRELAKANPEYNGKYKRTLRQYNNLKNELIHSSFFTEYVVLNQQFKESLFDKETAESIGTAEEFREALSSLYEEEYKGNPESVEEEMLSYGLQQLENLDKNTLERMMNKETGFKNLVNKIKEFFRNLANVFKGNSNPELRYAERMADKFNKLYNKLEGIKSKTEGVRFSKEYTFNKQVDDALGNRIQRGYSVYVGKLPNLLAKCGLDPELPMLMQPSHIRDINHERDINNRHWHGIDKELIKQIPKMLKNPVMIYDSISEINKENSVCILTSECDSKGDPIIIVLTNSEQSNKYLDVKLEVVKTNASNHIDTMYGREGFRYHIKDIVDANAVLYVSKDGIEKLLNNKNLRMNSDGKLELLARLDNLRFDTIIHKSNNIVNTKSMQNSENDADNRKSKQKNNKEYIDNNTNKEYNENNIDLISDLLEASSIKKVKMITFPPYNISRSEANQIATRWANKPEIEAGTKKAVSYHDRWYVIEKYDSADMKYQIIGRISAKAYMNILKEVNRRERNFKTQTIQSATDGFTDIDETRDSFTRGRYSVNADNVGYKGENINVRRMGENQTEERSVYSNSHRSDEQGFENRGYNGGIIRKSKQTLPPQTDEEISEKYEELNKKYGSIKKGEKWERDVSVPKRTEKRKYVSRFARTMAESDIFPEENMSEFERLVVSGKMSHEQLSDKKVEESTIRLIKEEGYEAALQHFLLSSRQGIVKKDVIALGQQLLNQAYTAKDVETAMKLSSELAILATEAGRSVQAQRMLKKLSPDGQLYYLEKTIQKINRELESKNIKDDTGNIAVVRMNEEKAEKLFKAKSQQEIDEAVAEITTDIAHQMPVTFSDKWNAWRYMAMLANPKTHIRNMLGNAFFVPMSAAKNIIGATMENVMLSPEQRTKAYKMDEKVREFAEKDFENVLDILKGEAKYTGDTKIEREKIVFKTKALEAIRQKNSDFLDAEDAIFLKYHYTRALARIMTARGITAKQLEFDSKGTNSLLEKIREVAIEEAQRNTFRDTNAVANYISRTQSKLRKHALGKPVAGVIEGILPFKNTPLNIAKQGWYYSPGGLIQGISEYIGYVKGKEISASQAIDHMASGLTGMAVAALGGLLLQLGFLTKLPDDDKEKTLGKLMGTQNYALQIGSVSYSIDWVAPAIMPLAIGASLVESLRDTNASPITAMINAFNKMTEPVFELSCLQGVSSMLETVAFYEGAAPLVMAGEALLSYTGQAIPTISGQLARTVDKTQRQTVADENSFLPDKLQYFIQNQAKKIPCASRFVTPKIDAWGNEMTYADNAVARTVEQFFSPGYIDTKENDAVNDELKRLNISTGHTSHIPGNAKKSVEADGKTHYFNKTEYLLYNKTKGQTSKEILDVMINLPEYKTLTDEQKVEVISEYAYKYSAALAKVKTIKGEKFQTKYYSEDYSRWSITKIAKDMIKRKIASDKKKEND